MFCMSLLDQCVLYVIIGPVCSACHYWTSVFCMSLVDQCVLYVITGPVCSACHYWTSVFCMSLLDQCVLHVITGPVCSACYYWTSMFCMSLLDQCVLNVDQCVLCMSLLQGGPSPRSCHNMCLDEATRTLFFLGQYVKISPHDSAAPQVSESLCSCHLWLL